MLVFSKRLREERLKKGFTQKEMADKLNITQGSYGKWENGRTEPNLENIVKLSKILFVSANYLLGIGGELGGDEDMLVFSRRLKEERLEKGLTQKELGEKVGVKQNTFTNWERGTREPSFENLIKLAFTLGKTTDYLLGVEDLERKGE